MTALSCLALSADAVYNRPNQYIQLSVTHELAGQVGQDYTFNVYGAGGRPLYRASVKVWANGIPLYEGDTGLDGTFTFKPEYTGYYDYVVRQGRYRSIGGEFRIVNETVHD